jgi:hypothetical protein
MSAITATGSASSNSAIAQLLADGLSNARATTGLPQTAQTGSSSTSGTSSGNPTDTIDLSDYAKAVLAQAQQNQVLADQLQEQVQSNKNPNGSGNTSASSQASDNVTQSFDQLTGQTPSHIPPNQTQTTGNEYAAEFGTQDGSMYGILVTPTEPGSAVATVLPIVSPKISFSNQIQAGGFTVSAAGDASNGTYSFEIDGPDGIQWSDQQLDPNLGQGVIHGSPPAGLGGLAMGTPGPGNIETVTFSENSATAESVTASSNAGTVSMSTANAQTISETVSINFSTGAIELRGSAASMQSTQLNISA